MNRDQAKMKTDIQEKMTEAIDKISNERAEQVDSFITAILKVRQEVDNEVLDMNYIALQHDNDLVDGKYLPSVKVVYMKQKNLKNCYNCNKYINHGFGWIECNVIPKSACVDIDYCSEWQQK